MDKKIKWINDPFPHLIIDNFLSEEHFNQLTIELDNTKNIIQRIFKTSLENKIIYKDTLMTKNVRELVDRMGSLEIKKIISQIIDSKNILSMGDLEDYGGYSPYHITENNGFLGSHVDHSSIKGGKFKHIANTIFYASSRWQKGWGGHTILFSRNGLSQKVKIDPIPNRLIFFIHSANSFHGVSRYFSEMNIQRRTFYHDYYVSNNEINQVMFKVNLKRKNKIHHSFHDTTFVPFLPFGIKKVKIRTIFLLTNFKYISGYFKYLINLILKKSP
tara:strand:- start:18105 stop:18923 length:819 start_codon:yes stop_codon:yes gene_type:complete